MPLTFLSELNFIDWKVIKKSRNGEYAPFALIDLPMLSTSQWRWKSTLLHLTYLILLDGKKLVLMALADR